MGSSVHRAVIFNVWNRAFSLGGDWNDEKVSLGVAVAVLVTYVPLANARACHSYTDCYLRRARVPFSVLLLVDNLVPVSLCFLDWPPPHTHSPCAGRQQEIPGLEAGRGELLLGLGV